MPDWTTLGEGQYLINLNKFFSPEDRCMFLVDKSRVQLLPHSEGLRYRNEHRGMLESDAQKIYKGLHPDEPIQSEASRLQEILDEVIKHEKEKACKDRAQAVLDRLDADNPWECWPKRKRSKTKKKKHIQSKSRFRWGLWLILAVLVASLGANGFLLRQNTTLRRDNQKMVEMFDAIFSEIMPPSTLPKGVRQMPFSPVGGDTIDAVI